MILLSADTNTITLLLFIYFDESATWGERWGWVEGVSRSVVLYVCCVDRCLIFHPFSFLPFCFQFFFDLWILIILFYLQSLLSAPWVVLILSILIHNQICTRNSFIVSTEMRRTMCHVLWSCWLQQSIVYLSSSRDLKWIWFYRFDAPSPFTKQCE